MTYTGRLGLGAYLNVSFQAQPESVITFLKGVCSGNIYKGYNPFSAIDIGEPFTYAHPITVGEYPYYSYSPNTPPTVWGNRCGLIKGGWLQISVDAANSERYSVKMEVLFSCQICKYVPANTIYPISDFPIQVLGLHKSNQTYILDEREACIGLQQSIFTSSQKWTELIGSSILFTLDDQVIASAEISSQGQLVNRRDIHGESIEANVSGNSSFYCFHVNADKRLHTMGVQVSADSGVNHSRSWKFEIIDKLES